MDEIEIRKKVREAYSGYEEKLAKARKIRDQIKRKVEELIAER